MRTTTEIGPDLLDEAAAITRMGFAQMETLNS